MARPKLPIKRDAQLNLHLTRAEYELVKSRADAFGLRPVEYGRAVLLSDERTIGVAPTAPTARVDRLWLSHAARLGNNLNQLVRHCHMFEAPPPPSLEPLLQDIRDLLDRARADDS